MVNLFLEIGFGRQLNFGLDILIEFTLLSYQEIKLDFGQRRPIQNQQVELK